MKKELNKEQYAARRAALTQAMEDDSILFLFSGCAKQRTNDDDYPFTPDRNYYYITGLDVPGQCLVLTRLSGVSAEYLFVARPDPYLERYHGHMDTDEEYARATGIRNVYYLDKFDWHLGRLLSRNPFGRLYMDFHKRDLDTAATPETDLSARLLAAHPYLQPTNISRTICNMRRIKTPEEIEQISEAIRITGEGIRSIIAHLGDGAREAVLEAHFNFALRTGGASGNAFAPIIAGGANSNVLHYCDNCSTLHDGEVLLLDLGAEYGYYSADISRTLPVGGTFTPLQAQYYDAVLYAQQRIAAALRPGLPVDDTLEIARDALFEKCSEYGLTHNRADMERYLPHGVCHYLGLDTHDVGDRGLLEPGMVVTMEPGIYLPQYGFGVRIEDDALITADGCRILSASIPQSREEIEGMCRAAQAARGKV